MDKHQDEFFGTESQQNMLRKGRATYDLLSSDPRLTYYGRTVGISRYGPDTDNTFESLICLQGACWER